MRQSNAQSSFSGLLYIKCTCILFFVSDGCGVVFVFVSMKKAPTPFTD